MTDPYFVYASITDYVGSWIEQGGGVMVPGSMMGCGLNVLSCLGYIDRNELPRLIREQDSRESIFCDTRGMSMPNIIGVLAPTTTLYPYFISCSNEDNIEETINDIEYALKLPRTERYRYMILKLDIHQELGHIILAVYDSLLDKLSTFDPQKCRSENTTLRKMRHFIDYLSYSSFKGISMIKTINKNAGKKSRKSRSTRLRSAKTISKKICLTNVRNMNSLYLDFIMKGEKNDPKTIRRLKKMDKMLDKLYEETK